MAPTRPAGPARASHQQGWQVIGWQRISVRVPMEWNPGAIGGDVRNGYLRIDDPERPRLEAKWEQPKQGAMDLGRAVDKYLKSLQREARRRRHEFEVERDTGLLSKRRKRKPMLECFHWQADAQGYGAIWYCDQCDRLVMAQVTGERDEDLEALARKVLLSLEDHSREEDWDLWGVYELACEVPSSYALDSQELKTGMVQLNFVAGKNSLRVARYGLANVILKDAPLGAWCAYQRRKEWKGLEIEEEEITQQPHRVLHITGRPQNWMPRVRAALYHVFRQRIPTVLDAVAWECREANKVFLLEHQRDELDEPIWEELWKRTQCHG